MIHNHHYHDGCDHRDLRHCKACDVVFCRDCGKEWSSKTYTFGATGSGTITYLTGGIGHTGHVH